MGVDAGYDENDIYNSAKILTGLTLANLQPPFSDANPEWTRQEYFYDWSIHHPSPVTVMGKTFNTHGGHGGEADATTYLLWLARHPKTAERLARKLCTHFVSDDPPSSLVTRLASVYTAHDTAIAPVLKALFTSREFAVSVEHKVRRPYEDTLAGLRTLGLTQSTLPQTPKNPDDPSWSYGLQAIYWQVRDMGHAPLNWPQPDGYPDVAVSWQSASGILGRWSTHMSHSAGWWPSHHGQAPHLAQEPGRRNEVPQPQQRRALPAAGDAAQDLGRVRRRAGRTTAQPVAAPRAPGGRADVHEQVRHRDDQQRPRCLQRRLVLLAAAQLLWR